MSSYSTRQRAILLAYLSRHPDERLSSQKIADDLKGEGVSQSTVYRNLAILETEGKVRRFSQESSRELLYQYMDTEECREALHLSCRCCGRTFHLSEELTKSLEEALVQQEDFQLDPSRTILYGLCPSCQKKGGKAKKVSQ